MKKIPFHILLDVDKKDDTKKTVEEVFTYLEDLSGVEIPRTYVDGLGADHSLGREWCKETALDPERNQLNTSKLWEALDAELQRND